MMKKFLALLIVAVLALGLVACGGTGEAEKKGDNFLKLGFSGYSGLFNPIVADNTYDQYVCDTIFESLIKLTPEGEYVPGNICEGWELSNENKTYTFTVKDGVKFSDGSPMTTADVEFTFKAMGMPDYKGPRAYAVAGMIGYADYNSGKTQTFEGIKVIDEKKISFTFEVASPANIECFSYGILSKAHYVFTTWEELIAYNEKPLGTGIMKLDSWAAKQFIKVVKNDAYWDKANAAKIDGVMMLEVSGDALLPALQTGEIDFAMPDAKADTVKALGEMKGVTTQKYIGNGYTFMCFNTLNPILSDVRVRQALMYGLDRASFIEAEYGSKDLAEVGLAPMSPTSWAFPDKSELNAYAFDLEKAGKLLDEAGWKLNADGKREKDGKPFEISWLVYTDSTWPGTLAGMAFDSWGKLGIKLNVEQMDFDTVASRTMDAKPGEKDFDIYTMGFQLSVDPDPTGALFDADAFVEGGFNASGFRDDKSQELIANGKKEFDTEKRAAVYKEWCKLQNELIPHVIIAYRNEIWGVNNRVKGMELGTYSDWVTQLGKITLEAPAK